MGASDATASETLGPVARVRSGRRRPRAFFDQTESSDRKGVPAAARVAPSPPPELLRVVGLTEALALTVVRADATTPP